MKKYNDVRIGQKITALILTCVIMALTFLPVTAYFLDDDGYPRSHYGDDYPETIRTSSDGRYQYYLDKETGEAIFYASLESDISVIEIPEKIDGYVVESVTRCKSESPSIVRVRLSENIKYILRGGLCFEEVPVPICMVDINEGLTSISKYSITTPLFCKLIVFPSTLEYIGDEAFFRDFCENIVFQSNPVTGMNSVSINDFPDFTDKYLYDLDFDRKAFNCYFTGDATNLSPFTFNYQPYNWERDLPSPETFPARDVTIYKKPGAQGFEKFLDSSHEEYITDYSISWKIPEYTVKEYTEEWWHDLAEIETVTMTAEGMTEITKNKGKGLSDAAKKYLSHEYEKSVKSGEAFTVSSAFAPADAYDNRTFFVSMNEDIATVDIETGEVKALKKGTARIRCVAASGVFADCILTVDGGDGTNGVAPTEAEVEANDTTSSETQTTAKQSQTQPNKALSFLADKKFYIIPAAVVLTAAVVAGCIVRKKKR